MKSLADELTDYQIAKAQRIERMKDSNEPNQEHELEVADRIIRNAINSALSVVIKLTCVNREAYAKGKSDSENATK